jgi:hypothetical protein
MRTTYPDRQTEPGVGARCQDGRVVVQECAWPGCSAQAAYNTRSRPAWCDEHVTTILHEGGLEPLEPFTGPNAWRLTRCLKCGCEAHYRFVYTIDKNSDGEATCRACYWRGWAADQRFLLAEADPGPAETVETVRALADAHGYDYLGSLTAPVLDDDPHRVRCRYCGRISAERAGDIAWGCSCQTNPRRAAMVKPAAKLLRDSDLPARHWWDSGRNPAELWGTATDRTRRAAWWRCPECALSFQARVMDMFARPICPDCGERRRTECAAQSDGDPTTVMAGDNCARSFRCTNGHYTTATPRTFLDNGCPTCQGQDARAIKAEAAIEEVLAEGTHVERLAMNPEIAEQWHPTRNGSERAADRSPGSRRFVWWREAGCGHEWQASPADREKGQRLRCPECRTILDSLAYHHPDIAAQWSPDNPRNPWYVRPNGQLPFLPEWVCPIDPTHKWRATTSARVNGADCPMCRGTGKSRVELLYFEAVRSAFGEAFSGLAMRSPAFTKRSVWVPDVTVNLPNGRRLLVEYDGSYWHMEKGDIDLDKSRDLLAAGALVVRLREMPLPSLDLAHRDYVELTVYPTLPEPDRVVDAIREWLVTRGRLDGTSS